MNYIKYRRGYKYQLAEDYVIQTEIIPDTPCFGEYFYLDLTGRLKIKKGYAFDGPSGPTFDTKDFMRGALVHDCCYQAMREHYLDHKWRKAVDRLLQQLCLEDGMSQVRAWYVYQSVRLFADPCTNPNHEAPVITAPEGCVE